MHDKTEFISKYCVTIVGPIFKIRIKYLSCI